MRYKGVELHSDEEVKRLVRQFPLGLIRYGGLAALLVIGAFFFLIPLWNLRLWRWDIHLVGQAIFYLSLFSAVLLVLRHWVIWRGTFLLITNQRVLDVDRQGFFERTVSEVPYQSLSDVSYNIKGIVETLADIGTISFQMFSGNETIAFKNLLDPARVHKQVMELRVAFQRGAPSVSDPVEGILNTVGSLSPTEQRALFTTLKKTAPNRTVKRVKPPEELP